MKIRQSAAAIAVALVVTTALVSPLAQSADRVDLDAINRIKEEGLQRSQVMDIVSYLTDVYGPRLTNSPQIRAAADWAADRMSSWQLSAVHQEPWGPFGRGWSNERFSATVIEPLSNAMGDEINRSRSSLAGWPLLGFSKAWTPGTDGVVTADLVHAVLDSEEDFVRWQGRLRGKVVLPFRPPNVRVQYDPPGRRYTDRELEDMEKAQPTPPRPPAPPNFTAAEFARRRTQFFFREGIIATMEPGTGVGNHGSVLVQGYTDQWKQGAPQVSPQIVVAAEHYGRIVRALDRKFPVKIELRIENRYYLQPQNSFNLFAEIPGTDKADEVVMLGGHLDSWGGGTGATDNAAGVAAAMEAMRILKTTGVRLRRTVRLALWTGEEQGLLGSKAYVQAQFGDPDTMELKPAHQKLSAYFNLDNGTGAIRGVYLQGNEAVRPIFKSWMEPFQTMGMKTLTIRGTGGTDHLSFDAVGLPAFQFIQDPMEYYTLSHHSNMDLYERVVPEDMTKNAVIMATFVYLAANRDELLPRKPLPKPITPR